MKKIDLKDLEAINGGLSDTAKILIGCSMMAAGAGLVSWVTGPGALGAAAIVGFACLLDP